MGTDGHQAFRNFANPLKNTKEWQCTYNSTIWRVRTMSTPPQLS